MEHEESRVQVRTKGHYLLEFSGLRRMERMCMNSGIHVRNSTWRRTGCFPFHDSNGSLSVTVSSALGQGKGLNAGQASTKLRDNLPPNCSFFPREACLIQQLLPSCWTHTSICSRDPMWIVHSKGMLLFTEDWVACSMGAATFTWSLPGPLPWNFALLCAAPTPEYVRVSVCISIYLERGSIWLLIIWEFKQWYTVKKGRQVHFWQISDCFILRGELVCSGLQFDKLIFTI